jgi:hypothetical protein
MHWLRARPLMISGDTCASEPKQRARLRETLLAADARDTKVHQFISAHLDKS